MNKKKHARLIPSSWVLLFVSFAMTMFMVSCSDDQQNGGNTVNDTSVATSAAVNDTTPIRRPNLRDPTKWAILKANDKYKEGKEFLVIFNDERDADEKLRINNYNIWFTDTLSRGFSKGDREGYELYIYGYLAYHDQNVRSTTGPHTIYFKWRKHGNTLYVDVYITPPYSPSLLGDPPRPKVPPPPPSALDEQ